MTLTDSDCAILAIAPTTQTVRELLQRLVKDVVFDDQATVVPWTIVNKYYTAKVNFLVHTVASWTAIQDGPLTPALLFVWNNGQPYRDHVRKLAQHASQHEFEVALAVRLPHTGSILSMEDEDDQDVDAYLSSEGFEFVNVLDIDTSFSDRSGIPGIPRVIDALSTIMWPSMVEQSSKQVTTTSFIKPGISPDDYHSLVRLVGEKISGGDGDRMHRELEELERWLDEDTLSGDGDTVIDASIDDDGIPWSTAVTPGTLSPSSSGFLENSRPTTPKAGFDDDFTCFVSASSPDVPRLSLDTTSSPHRLLPLVSTSFGSTFSFSSASSDHSTPAFDDHDVTRLAPGESYRSLGSTSDLGDLDRDLINIGWLSSGSGDADGGMPSRAEIVDTSRKIFGTVPLSLSPTQDRGDGSLSMVTALGGAPPQGLPGKGFDVEMTDADLERFDLQSVLGALQGLKEDISGMPDKERRKAAARVALGLAYGLGGNALAGASD